MRKHMHAQTLLRKRKGCILNTHKGNQNGILCRFFTFFSSFFLTQEKCCQKKNLRKKKVASFTHTLRSTLALHTLAFTSGTVRKSKFEYFFFLAKEKQKCQGKENGHGNKKKSNLKQAKYYNLKSSICFHAKCHMYTKLPPPQNTLFTILNNIKCFPESNRDKKN